MSELSFTTPVGAYFRLSFDNKEIKDNSKRKHRRKLENILINCKHDNVRLKNGIDGECGCIKRGLRDSLWRERLNPMLSEDDLIRLDYLRKYERRVIGRDTGITCDLDIAMEEYKSISEENPDASDEEKRSKFIKKMNEKLEEEITLELKP